MPVFEDLASGNICFPDWSTQLSECFMTIWSIRITEDGTIETDVSDLGSKDFPADSLAVCRDYCFPGLQDQKREPIILVDASSRAITIPPRSLESVDLLGSSTRAPTILFVATDLVTRPATSPSASFVPAPCGDEILFNKGNRTGELCFTTKSTAVARFLHEQARRERALAEVIEKYEGTDKEPIMTARLAIAQHQDRNPCDMKRMDLEKWTTQMDDLSLPERFRHLVNLGEASTLGDLVGRVCTAVFLTYYCYTSEVSPEQRMELRNVMVRLQCRQRIYMPNNRDKVVKELQGLY